MSDGTARAFKYAERLAKIDGCPPDGRARDAYAFVRYSIADPRAESNFLPKARSQPKRKWKTDAERCSSWGLSMFIDEASAQAVYDSVATRHPEPQAALGTHLAIVPVGPDDGELTPVDQLGHRDLHEYEGTDLSPRAVLIRAIVGVNNAAT